MIIAAVVTDVANEMFRGVAAASAMFHACAAQQAKQSKQPPAGFIIAWNAA